MLSRGQTHGMRTTATSPPKRRFRFGALFLVFCVFVATARSSETEDPKTADAPPPAPTGPLIVLEPFSVTDQPPKLCFGIALEVWSNGNNGKVTSIYIKKVKPHSHAEELGLGPRTRIDRIDGVPVEELTASFNNDTVLNKTFINRKIGDRVTLEVLLDGTLKTKTVTLIEKPNFKIGFRVINWGAGNN